MAFKINTTAMVSNDTTVNLGVFATYAALPSAPTGSIAYVTADEQLYYRKANSTWSPITAKYGSVYKPATNAAQIYNAGDGSTDGAYYIASTSGVITPYCDMTNGAYMLAATIDNSTDDNWMWGGSYWQVTSPLNESGTTTLANSDSINRLYYEYTMSSIRCCLGSKGNALQYTYSGTAKTLFNSGRSTSFGRSAWMSWAVNGGIGVSSSQWDNQPNCNAEGFGIRAGSADSYGRFFIGMNNEGPCDSNDSGIGFGWYSNGYATVAQGNRNTNAGGSTWNPDARYPGVGYIFVK
jgi:hypothetical protein